jgi:hypothetical protein
MNKLFSNQKNLYKLIELNKNKNICSFYINKNLYYTKTFYISQYIQTPNKPKKENLYLPRDKLLFSQGKSLVVLTKKDYQNYTGMLIMKSVISVSIYKLIMNLITLNYGFAALWGLNAISVTIVLKGEKLYYSSLIKSIYLLSDGKRIEINLFNGNKIIEDIKNVRRMNKYESALVYTFKNIYNYKAYPLVVGSEVLFISKYIEKINREILSVIGNSSYVVVDSNADREKIINIK